MSDVLTTLERSTIIPAMEANMQAAALRWAALLDAEVREEADASWFFSTIPFNMFNGVIRADFPPADTEARITSILQQFKQRNLPLAWLIYPSARPVDLAQRLLAHDLTFDDEAPAMAVDLFALSEQAALPSGLTIKEVDSDGLLTTWIQILVAGSGFPPAIHDLLLQVQRRHPFAPSAAAHFYLGFLEGAPVATAMLFHAGGVAGLYNVTTLSQARQQGIGTAITLFSLHHARALGYHIGALQASQMGYSVYKRLGFQEYGRFSFYFGS